MGGCLLSMLTSQQASSAQGESNKFCDAAVFRGAVCPRLASWTMRFHTIVKAHRVTTTTGVLDVADMQHQRYTAGRARRPTRLCSLPNARPLMLLQ